MKAGVFPPTLIMSIQTRKSDLEGSGLFIAPEPPDLGCPDDRPRRLQVNAFGLEVWTVVQLEQAMDEAAPILVFPGGEPGLARERGNGVAECGLRIADPKTSAHFPLERQGVGLLSFRASLASEPGWPAVTAGWLSWRNPKRRR